MDSYKQDDWVVVVLPDVLDRNTGQDFMQAIDRGLEEGNERFVADCAKLNYIDSFGISSFLRQHKRIAASEGEFRVRDLKGQPLYLILQTGTDRFLRLEVSDATPAGQEPKQEDNKQELGIDKEMLGEITVLRFRGSLYFPLGVPEFKEKVHGLIEEGRKILFDFSDLQYLDSYSVNEMLSLNHKTKLAKGEIRVCGCNRIVQEILEALNVNFVITLFPNREEALADWQE